GTVDAEEIALRRLVDAAAAVVADGACEDLLGAATAATDRVGDVVDGAGAGRQQHRERGIAVDRAEGGQRAVVPAVAAADGEHLGALLAELARDLLDRAERLRDAYDPVAADDVAQDARTLAGAVPVRARMWIDDDADPRHVSDASRGDARGGEL